MSDTDIHTEMEGECRRLLCSVAIEASDQLPLSKRIMIHRAIAGILPPESAEQQRAAETAAAFAEAERRQLHLADILTAS